MDKNNYRGNNSRNHHNGNNNSRGRNHNTPALVQHNAEAPYNFVPLISEVVTGEIDEVSQTAYKEHVLAHGKNTGYIDLEITSKSPLFIGGNGEKFFAPSGKPMIPGSSIRGMVKNLFKIITFGSMRPGEDIEDKTMYFRGLAAKGSLGRYYNKCMITRNKNFSDSKGQAGFMIKIKNTDDYYICPAKCERKSGDIGCAEVNVDWPKTAKDIKECRCKIHTGPMFSKKHYYEIFAPDWSVKKRIQVPHEVVQGYDNDRTENDKLTRKSLRKMAKEDEEAVKFTGCEDICFVVPCFYVAENKNGKMVVKHFGHGKYYRIPYQKTIAEHVPFGVCSDKVVDLSDMIFGRTEMWGSRVFFEDAVHEGTVKKLGSSLTHPLLSPKPTSFQLYLEQESDADMNTLKHWDEEAKIRGYKLYWHQGNNENNWKINGNNDKRKKKEEKVEGMAPITPLSADNRFKGRIRFSNLSDVELGALLAVFDFARKDKNICYKLGMGKSIGLGSVTISAGLHLIDEAERYSGMFAADGMAEGDADGEKQWDGLISGFEAYRSQHLQREKAFQRGLSELKTMLDWSVTKNQASWLPKMAYMPIGDKTDHRYRDRAILKKPSEYIQ